VDYILSRCVNYTSADASTVDDGVCIWILSDNPDSRANKKTSGTSRGLSKNLTTTKYYGTTVTSSCDTT
jgi:hypothetical protein